MPSKRLEAAVEPLGTLAGACGMLRSGPATTWPMLVSLLLVGTLVAAVPHDPDARVRALTERLAESPEDPSLWAGRGRLYLARGDLPLAVRDFRFALGLEGGEVEARLGLSRAALAGGDAEEALRQIERAVARLPGSLALERTRAEALAALGRAPAAAASWARAVRTARDPRPDDWLAAIDAYAGLPSGIGQSEAAALLQEAVGSVGLVPALEETAQRLGIELRRPEPKVGDAARLPLGPVLPPSSQPMTETILLPAGSVWRYHDLGANLGTSWRQPGFDDSSWASGPAQLGYGDGDESTVVGYGGNAGSKFITTYFRSTFQVADPNAFLSAWVRLLRDDGAVVYVNGTEVFRSNMPGGALNHQTLASQAIAGAEEGAFFEWPFAPGLLRVGTNVVAVEVHQVNATSSDISFDLELFGADSERVIRGPYLQRGSSTGAVVRWRTDLNVDTVLWTGPSPQALTPAFQDTTPKTEHVVELQNLTPATTYYYAIGSAAGILAGGDADHSFRTHPTPGQSTRTRIWAIGDSGTADANARRVRDAYETVAGPGPRTDVWLMLGDNAYVFGTDAEYQAAVFDTYPEQLRDTFVWSTLGNHDGYSASSATETGPYYDLFTLPRAGESGGVPSGTEAYYSFDHGHVHFVCLDSFDSDRSGSAPMASWLRADLQAARTAGAQWLIAFFHHPPYTKGSHDSDNPADSAGRMDDMRQVFLPILESYGVDLVLSGHSHSYERSFLLDGHYGTSGTLLPGMVRDLGDGTPGSDGSYAKAGTGLVGDQGAVYVVAGSSGTLGGGSLDHPATYVGLSRLGSVLIDIDGPNLQLAFIDDFTAIRDVVTIQKGLDRTLVRRQPRIDVAGGGRQDWSLDFGAQHGGRGYVVAGSFGTSPGTSLGGLHIPLNPDAWFDATLDAANSSFLPGSLGRLDAAGRASAALVLPPWNDPGLVGVELFHAAIVFNSQGVHAVSNPVRVLFE